MKSQKEKLVREFIRTIKVPNKNLKKQIIIAPVGVVAAGKTTAMKVLIKMLPIIYINNDEARLFLRKNKIWGPLQANDITSPVIKYFLKKGKSILIDGDFVDEKKRKSLENSAKNFHAKVFYIHVVAPEKFILKKLKNKKWTKRGLFSEAGIALKEYFRRKLLHKRKLNIKFIGTVNTSEPIKTRLSQIILKINKYIGA